MDPIVVSERCQEFAGRKFWRERQRYYKGWVKIDGAWSIRYLHRAVWEFSNGPIPPGKGWHVHHRNGDPTDNRLENLDLLDAAAHLGDLHMTEERREASRKRIHRAIQAARAWHGTESGRAWHSEHGKDGWRGRATTTKTCEHCGATYQTHRPEVSKFCHTLCKSASMRRRHGQAPATGKPPAKIDAVCAICAQTFHTRPKRSAPACSDRCVRALKSLRSGRPVAVTFSVCESQDPGPTSSAE